MSEEPPTAAPVGGDAGGGAAPARNRLREQLEFYFSARNLQTDAYLLGQMDKQLRVPVEVVEGFHRVKEMTPTREALLEAVRGSSTLRLVEEDGRQLIAPAHIRPALRTTLILREVPADCSEEEVVALFSEPPKSIKVESETYRYVTFATEEQAAAQHKHVINKKLRGDWVKARVKSESLSLNMLVAKHQAAEIYQHGQPPPPLPAHGHPPPMPHPHPEAGDPFAGYADPTYGAYPPPPPEYYPPYGMPPMPGWYEPQPMHVGKGGKRAKGGKKGKAGKSPHQTPPHRAVQPAFTAEDFPTLVQADGQYESEVVRWGREEIVGVLEQFKRDLQAGRDTSSLLPEPLPPADSCAAVLKAPNYQLELTRPSHAPTNAAPTMADRLKGGAAKPASAAQPSQPAAAAAAQPDSAAAAKPAQPSGAAGEGAAPAEAEAEAPESPSKRRMTWAEAVITASDVKISQPYTQYRAGLSGDTVLAPGGSTQQTDKEKPKEKEGGKSQGRGGGRGTGQKGGRGGGKGKGDKGGEKGDKGDKGEKGGKGKGKKKGGKKEGKRQADEPQAADAAAAAAPAKEAKEKPAAEPAAGSWAAVAHGLTKKK